jgi:hypothetical protein
MEGIMGEIGGQEKRIIPILVREKINVTRTRLKTYLNLNVALKRRLSVFSNLYQAGCLDFLWATRHHPR